MAGATIKQHSSKLSSHREAEVGMMRKPFSPIPSSTPPSKSTAANNMEDLNRKHDDLWQKLLAINKTPPNIKSRGGQENKTPEKTPTTVSIPMQTAITPASMKARTGFPVDEETDYSFEERRAQFKLSRSPLVNAARV